MHALLPILMMLLGIGTAVTPLGVAAGALQFGTAAIKTAPAIEQGIVQIETLKAQRCPCRKVVMRANTHMKQRIVRRCSKK